MSFYRSLHCAYVQPSADLFRTRAVAALGIFKHSLKFVANSVPLNKAVSASIRLRPWSSIGIEAHAPTVEKKV